MRSASDIPDNIDNRKVVRRPNLLYVMKTFPSLYQGTVLSEISVLRSVGYPVHVLSLDRPQDMNYAAAEALDGLITYGLDLREKSYPAVLGANLALISRIGLAAYLDLWALVQRFGVMGNVRGFVRLAAAACTLRRQGFTHLHAHWADRATEMAMILSRLSGLPFSFTCHAVDIFVSPRYLEEKLRAAQFVVTVSGYNKQYLMSHYGSDLEDKIGVIYPLVDIHEFTPRLPLRTHEINILSVGRLVEKKGYPYAIEAAGLLKERGYRFVWRIVGEGRDRPHLEAVVKDLGLSGWVQLLGKLPQDDIKSLLDQSTVFALSSVVASDGDREGMPRVLIEAMAKEVPVVATDSVGISELVRDGSGLLVPPGDSVALADAVEQIITLDWESRRVMGQTGRQIVEHEFDSDYLANKLIALFEAQSD